MSLSLSLNNRNVNYDNFNTISWTKNENLSGLIGFRITAATRTYSTRKC